MPNLLHHPASGGFSTAPGATVDEPRGSGLRPSEDLGARAAIAGRLFGEHASPVMIGRFRVTRRLGAGGMGRVYEAIDAELDRRVALKLLAEREHQGGAAPQRMLREARSLARLSHPNVVQIFDVGEHDGSIFLAMEYVDGQTLERWQESEHRWRAVLDKYLQAGEGLAAVHANGLVHRDFKPANVLVDTTGRVKVADFGVAIIEGSGATTGADRPSERDRSSSGSMRLTQSGAMLGTPAYMSPEQLRAGTVDARSDQFSFSFSLYDAVFGQQPFSVEQRRERASTHELGHRRAPGWLRAVLLRGLAMRPEERWPDMETLLRALRRGAHRVRTLVLGGAALGVATAIASASAWLASPGCSDSRAALDSVWNDERSDEVRFAFGRTGMPFAGASAATIVTRLDTEARKWSDTRVEVCRDHRLHNVSSAEFHDASMACLDRRLSDLAGVVTRLTDIDSEGVAHAEDLFLTLTPVGWCVDPEFLRDAASYVESPDENALRELVVEGRFELALGRADAALAAADAAIERARGLDAQRVWAEATTLRGRALESFDRWPEAEAAYLEAVRLAEASRHDELVVELWRRLFGLEATRDGLAAAQRWLVLLDGAVLRIGDPPIARANYLVAQGKLAVMRGDEAAAEHSLRAALARFAGAESSEGPDALEATRELANSLARQGRFGAAEELYRRAVELTRARWGEQHPDLALLEFDLGFLFFDKRDLLSALPHFERSLVMEERAYGRDALRLASTLVMIAQCRLALGDTVGARTDAERAVEIQRRLPRDAYERASGLAVLSNIQMAMGRIREAIATAEHALEVGFDPALDRVEAELAIAYLRCNLGECVEAIPNIERAAAEARADDRLMQDRIAALRVRTLQALAAR